MTLAVEQRNATRLGIPLRVYQTYIAQGLKRCSSCTLWQTIEHYYVHKRKDKAFPSSSCKGCLSVQSKQAYTGNSRKLPQDGNKAQAYRTIRKEIENGTRKHPNTLPCANCGRVWLDGDTRHEYHHHLGFAADFHTSVTPLCKPCHINAHRHAAEQQRQADLVDQ